MPPTRPSRGCAKKNPDLQGARAEAKPRRECGSAGVPRQVLYFFTCIFYFRHGPDSPHSQFPRPKPKLLLDTTLRCSLVVGLVYVQRKEKGNQGRVGESQRGLARPVSCHVMPCHDGTPPRCPAHRHWGACPTALLLGRVLNNNNKPHHHANNNNNNITADPDTVPSPSRLRRSSWIMAAAAATNVQRAAGNDYPGAVARLLYTVGATSWDPVQ